MPGARVPVRLLPLLAAVLVGCAEDAGEGDAGTGPTPSAPAGEGVRLATLAEGFDQPLWAVVAPGSRDLYVVEREGRVWRLPEAGGREPWADLTDRVGSDASERGLLGLAFHPTFAGGADGAGGAVVASYTDTAGDTVLARFAATPAALDPASEEVLFTVDQPFANHNGGHILYGPDGMLWFGLGDGGAANDPLLNGQNKATVLGSLLRLDVGAQGPLRVPPDNPFVADPAGADEVWAYGLRNPWRFSFAPNGDLWLGDVGQDAWEEVNHLPASSGTGRGANLGWNLFEGSHPTGTEVGTAPQGFTFPVAEYPHRGSICSVTAGYAYRGEDVPALVGRYVFADFCSGEVWSLPLDDAGAPAGDMAPLLESGAMVASFAEDADGELLLLDFQAGTVLRFVGS